MRWPALVAALTLVLAGVARAEPSYDDPKTATGWAWEQIRDDRVADFNEKCGKKLDPHKPEGPNDPCRQVSAQFLVDILTRPALREQIGRHGVRLIGARIEGLVDLDDAEIRTQVLIGASTFDGSVNLYDSHWFEPLMLQNIEVTGDFLAERMRADSTVLLRNNSTFAGIVDLFGAKIGGDLEMNGSTFAKPVNGNGLSVEGSLFMGNATLAGNVDLGSVKIGSTLELDGSSFAGTVTLNRAAVGGGLFMRNHATFSGQVDLVGAKIGSNLEMTGCTFAKMVNGNRLRVEGHLLMRDHSKFDGAVNLGSAKISGNLEMDGSSFVGTVNANQVTVDGGVFMRNHATFRGGVDLGSAKIGSNLEMDGSSFAGTVSVNRAAVAGSVFMRNHAAFIGSVDLRSARIGSNLEMDSSSFAGTVSLNRATVGGSVFMRNHARFTGSVDQGSAKIGSNLEMDTSSFAKEVDLSGANIGGDVRMKGAAFAGPLFANTLKVTADLFMSNQAKFSGPVILIGAKIGGDLALSGSTAWQINLSGARAQELLIQGLGWWCAGGEAPISGESRSAKAVPEPILPSHWPLRGSRQRVKCDDADRTRLPTLILRNAYFADFQDSPDAWPPSLDLEGFRYDRLGASGGTGRSDMRRRLPEEWADWMARNDTFSTQPYTELASVLAAAGHRDTADAILLIGRERERGEAWTEGRYISWAWLSFLSYVVGYGIGLYTFLVLIWVVGLTVLGADILWYSERARRRGLLWRLGASLHRLLPVIELSKEFTDFFDNRAPPPGEEPDLSRFQVTYFAGHALAGWILGFFLIAAMGGILQKS